jgi:hypothetical protein
MENIKAIKIAQNLYAQQEITFTAYMEVYNAVLDDLLKTITPMEMEDDKEN